MSVHNLLPLDFEFAKVQIFFIPPDYSIIQFNKLSVVIHKFHVSLQPFLDNINYSEIKMKKSIWSLVGAIAVLSSILLFLPSCKRERVLSQEYAFPNRQWTADKFVTFTFEVPQDYVGKKFDMFIEIDHSPDIRRNSIKMDIIAYSPVDERSAEYNIFLKGADGRFKGKAEGNLLHFSQLLRNQFVFGSAGTWTFEFIQRSELFYFEELKSMRLVFRENTEKAKK